MIEKRQDDFRVLQSRGIQILEDPYSLPEQQLLKGHSLAFRLWHYPALHGWTSWLVYLSSQDEKSESPCSIRKVHWDRTFDSRRMGLPLEGFKHGFSTKPTVTLWQCTISDPNFVSLLEGYGQLSIPLQVETFLALDGEGYGVETFGVHQIKVSWWCSGPDEWRSLITWAENVRSAVQPYLENAEFRVDM